MEKKNDYVRASLGAKNQRVSSPSQSSFIREELGKITGLYKGHCLLTAKLLPRNGTGNTNK